MNETVRGLLKVFFDETRARLVAEPAVNPSQLFVDKRDELRQLVTLCIKAGYVEGDLAKRFVFIFTGGAAGVAGALEESLERRYLGGLVSSGRQMVPPGLREIAIRESLRGFFSLSGKLLDSRLREAVVPRYCDEAGHQVVAAALSVAYEAAVDELKENLLIPLLENMTRVLGEQDTDWDDLIEALWPHVTRIYDVVEG